MNLLSKFRNLCARPPAGKQRTGKPARPAPPKANPIVKSNAGIPPAGAPIDPIGQARQDAVAAESEVIKISRAHLGTLMASPPRVRIAHLADPDLTSADRTELEHSVRSALPRSAPAKSSPSNLRRLLQRMLRACGYRCAVATVLLSTGGLLAAMAWHDTGERMVGSRTTWIIDWRLPDGSIFHGAWKAGIAAIAMGPHNGKVVLRHWLPGRGYATTEVDENWLLRNSFDYVVAPTGVTGFVSPANR